MNAFTHLFRSIRWRAVLAVFAAGCSARFSGGTGSRHRR
jgi:hypothetical protein